MEMHVVDVLAKYTKVLPIVFTTECIVIKSWRWSPMSLSNMCLYTLVLIKSIIYISMCTIPKPGNIIPSTNAGTSEIANIQWAGSSKEFETGTSWFANWESHYQTDMIKLRQKHMKIRLINRMPSRVLMSKCLNYCLSWTGKRRMIF